MSSVPPPAFLFDSAGIGEWVLFMAIVLIVVGPKRLPAAARKLGKIMNDLRRAAQSFKDEVMKLDEPVRDDKHDDFPQENHSPEDSSLPDDGSSPDSYSDDPYDAYARRGYYDGEEPGDGAEPNDSGDGGPADAEDGRSAGEPAAAKPPQADAKGADEPKKVAESTATAAADGKDGKGGRK